MPREDYYTHTEADAGRYEAAYGPDYDDDRPTRSELDAEDAWTPGPHNRPLPTEGPLADALRRYREARKQARGCLTPDDPEGGESHYGYR